MVERWHADSRPARAFRHGGQVIVTRDVQEEIRENEDETLSTGWSYEVVRLDDGYVGDPGLFCRTNYSAIRQAVLLAHWPYSAQLEARDEAEEDPARPGKLEEFKAFVIALKEEFPKP